MRFLAGKNVCEKLTKLTKLTKLEVLKRDESPRWSQSPVQSPLPTLSPSQNVVRLGKKVRSRLSASQKHGEKRVTRQKRAKSSTVLDETR